MRPCPMKTGWLCLQEAFSVNSESMKAVFVPDVQRSCMSSSTLLLKNDLNWRCREGKWIKARANNFSTRYANAFLRPFTLTAPLWSPSVPTAEKSFDCVLLQFHVSHSFRGLVNAWIDLSKLFKSLLLFTLIVFEHITHNLHRRVMTSSFYVTVANWHLLHQSLKKHGYTPVIGPARIIILV